MARQPRDLSQSQWFHVVQRGADRQDLFIVDRDRHLYETLIAESFDRWRVELHAYALMTNHTHLLVRVDDDGSLSDAMHHLGSRYALAFNRSTGRDGPLFTSRFHSTSITSDAQLAQTGRYIHRNPLAFVPSRALAAYRWSSLGPICGRRASPDWLERGVIGHHTDVDAYLASVLEPQPSDRFPFGTLDPLRATSLEEIIAAVAEVVGLPPAALRSAGPSTDEPRTMAIMLAIDMRSADPLLIARWFDLTDRRSVRRTARRGRARVAQSPQFARFRGRVLDQLDQFGVDRAPVPAWEGCSVAPVPEGHPDVA
jgi:REP element-mobilizing transposase RayT